MKIGIIGAGLFGERHAQAIAQIDGLRLVAACRQDATLLQAFVERHGGRPYTSYTALLADPEVEAVVVATPHHLHDTVAVAAARAGKHLLLEKPMAHDLDACRRILEAANSAGVVLALGHIERCSRAYRIAKGMLEAGELGEVVSGVSFMRKRWLEMPRHAWHLDRAMGGGVLLTAGIHAVDRLNWLVGAPVASVSAQIATRFHQQEAEDSALLFLRYQDGAAGAVLSLGYRDGVQRHDTELHCTDGILRIDSVGGVWIGRGETLQHLPESGNPAWMDEALVDQWRAFQRSVASGEPPLVDGEEGMRTMAVLFAAEVSSREQREVAL